MTSRRNFLFDSYLGLGSLALLDMVPADAALPVRKQHIPAKARSQRFRQRRIG